MKKAREKKMLLENHKEEKIHLQSCTVFIKKSMCTSGHVKFKQCCSRSNLALKFLNYRSTEMSKWLGKKCTVLMLLRHVKSPKSRILKTV